ncbi:hypothetical protein QBC34DRAFT_213301 [Podospora aff. communis PSN243]|uniref:Rhodopsin domain-containing protein n=1 Tax=Podospora aff. communis PSN243 TaxID=3040156 RepID=A0AAV9G4Y1_9PEZI|nr:hypothetical protein QBC34DRAFT_213301 [Podospora aff. communis PSN243]
MEDRRPVVVAVTATLQALAWLAVAVRLGVRYLIIKRRLWWDDALIAIAMIPVTAHAVLQIMTTKYGLGLHIQDANLADLPMMGYYLWLSAPPFNLSHMFIKFSYLAFYLCIMPERRGRIALYSGMVFVGAVGITFTILSIFMCTPIQRGWDKTVEGTCIEEQPYLFSNAAFNMAADIIVFVLPIPTLWSLQLPLRQRLILLGTFTCGSVILVANIVRLTHIYRFTVPPTQDPTWDITGVIIWAEIEVQLAVILSCAASFKALAQKVFPGFMDGLSGSSRRKTTRTTGGGAGVYALESQDRTGFRTVTHIEAGGRPVTAKKQPADSDSVDSREHIVEGAATAAGWPPRMETTISVHSSKWDSADEAPVKKGSDP